MNREQHQPTRELPSIRDYWSNPTGFSSFLSSEPGRRSPTKPQVTTASDAVITPSLWGSGTGESLADRQPASGQVNELTALSSLPLTGEIVTENKQQLADRVAVYGVSSLSTPELLTLILRTGAGSERRVKQVHELVAQYNVQQLLQLDFGTFSEQYGLGQEKAAQLQAVLEMARRLLLPPPAEKYQIRDALDAIKLVTPDMAFLDHEEMRVLVLDTKNYVIANLLLYKGTINTSVLRAAEIYKPAVARNSPHIILCHNHPSGSPEPSPEDRAVTLQLIEAGKLLDIELLDHLIIGNNHRFTSLKEHMRW
jgi:DNA repair protein RadC